MLTLLLVGAVVLSGMGCGRGDERTPAPIPTAIPTPGPRGEEAVAAGKALISAKGCAFCHGADGGGTAQVPAIVYR
ncbi:MAG: c-type cytochrome, partial [Chloroflexota bacterium]|nr:c-type cytochrome [Chloroflexota bacterium]